MGWRKTILALIVGSVGLGGGWYLWNEVVVPPPPFETPREVLIKKGEGLRSIAAKLKSAGVVKSAPAVMVYARAMSVEQRLHPGDYEFAGGETVDEVVHHLVKGDFITITVTVPEGLNAFQIAQRLEQDGLGCDPEFADAAKRGDLVKMLGLEPLGAEGYLFPATYKFSPRDSTSTIMAAMLQRFYEVMTPTVERRLFDLQITQRELVTLASIIEKEAKVPGERPLIASVFYNRLKLHMPLQSDPTAEYGYDGADESASKAVHTPSIFNTYGFLGLPPGPIASPGLPSIKAALYPAHSDYLYFVARRDGTHIFSRSLQEHNRAVALLRKATAKTTHESQPSVAFHPG